MPSFMSISALWIDYDKEIYHSLFGRCLVLRLNMYVRPPPTNKIIAVAPSRGMCNWSAFCCRNTTARIIPMSTSADKNNNAVSLWLCGWCLRRLLRSCLLTASKMSTKEPIQKAATAHVERPDCPCEVATANNECVSIGRKQNLAWTRDEAPLITVGSPLLPIDYGMEIYH